MIGREIAPFAAVEIQLADFERVLAERIGDILDHALAADHALRAAETAKGGVGDGIGLQRPRAQPDIRIEIAVVGVEERTVGDRTGEIGRKTAARREDGVDRLDAALVVEADLVVDVEVMTLAGRSHVVVPVGTDLDGATVFLGGQRRHGCKHVCLRFLAAEGAAHAAHVDCHGVGRHAEHLADHVLGFARMLGRGIDRDLVVLAGNGKGDMALEIEVVLAADAHLAFDDVLRLGKAGGDIATLQLQGIDDQRIVRRPQLPARRSHAADPGIRS